MPPKRKSDDADLDDRRERFQMRGDLPYYRSKLGSDCAVSVGEERLLLHKSFLISRSGFFKELLTGEGKLRGERKERVTIKIDSHDIKQVLLMMEFIYGDGKVEILEYPSEEQPFIQDCVLLYNLGHDFDIPKMVSYAIRSLGMHLSKKLKEICIYPVTKAVKAVDPAFRADLEAGIKKAETARAGGTDHAQKNHPRRMLLDFFVAGEEVLLRDAVFRFNIDEGSLPRTFVKDALLARYDEGYQTPWMRKLMVRPEKLTGPEPKKRGNCAGCGQNVHRDQKVVFNPWSQRSFAQTYTQICCDGCAREMDEGSGTGVSWEVFDVVKEE